MAVRVVRLGDPDLSFDFRAGQAVMVGTHGQPVRKPYSIACSPEETAADHVIELLVGTGASATPAAQRLASDWETAPETDSSGTIKL